uniref:CKK domain-containing protein n=1 Tax=Angiostrongylus cantonensis TaxID=6313 RepID=A0A0K0DR97_ANGCA
MFKVVLADSADCPRSPKIHKHYDVSAFLIYEDAMAKYGRGSSVDGCHLGTTLVTMATETQYFGLIFEFSLLSLSHYTFLYAKLIDCQKTTASNVGNYAASDESSILQKFRQSSIPTTIRPASKISVSRAGPVMHTPPSRSGLAAQMIGERPMTGIARPPSVGVNPIIRPVTQQGLSGGRAVSRLGTGSSSTNPFLKYLRISRKST